MKAGRRRDSSERFRTIECRGVVIDSKSAAMLGGHAGRADFPLVQPWTFPRQLLLLVLLVFAFAWYSTKMLGAEFVSSDKKRLDEGVVALPLQSEYGLRSRQWSNLLLAKTRQGRNSTQLPQTATIVSPDAPRPVQRGLKLNIAQLGAIGDGMTDNTEIFRDAIVRIRNARGGTVFVPNGIFRSAPLELVTNLTLFLDRGAVLKAIDDFKVWKVVKPLESYGAGREGRGKAEGRRIAFLYGEKLENVALTGNGGCIDGSGAKWWRAKDRSDSWDGITLPHLIELQHTKGLLITGLRLIDSPMWTVHPFACTDIVIRDVEIFNPVHAHNTDGIDPDSCENVLIENVVFRGGDDGIALKSGWDCFGDERGFNRPTRNVVIRNFTVIETRAAAIAIGSEMSGGISDVVIEDLRVIRAGAGGALCIKTTAARSGYVRNITVSRLAIGELTGPENQVAGVMIVGRLGGWVPERNPACKDVGNRIPNISGISIRDVVQLDGTLIHGPAVRFEGLEEGQVLRSIHLEDIDVDATATFPGICVNAEVRTKAVSFSKAKGKNRMWHRGHGCSIAEETDV